MATGSAFVLLLLLYCCDSVKSVNARFFYPYGEGTAGSGKVADGDSSISPRVNLGTPIRFYNNYYNSLYVHSDGLITFGKNPGSISKLRHRKYPFPAHYPTIAPFYAPVSVGRNSHVTYRASKKEEDLNQATADVRSSFYHQSHFKASFVFVATWSGVKHRLGKFANKANTYQAVIITDSKQTFVILNYDDEGIQWSKGYNVHYNGLRQHHGQTGFSAGDNIRYYTLPGSEKKAVKALSSRSNINKPGKWMFRVGWPDMYGLNIQSADSYSPADQQNKPEKSAFFSTKCK